jgi:hypothetical protein
MEGQYTIGSYDTLFEDEDGYDYAEVGNPELSEESCFITPY